MAIVLYLPGGSQRRAVLIEIAIVVSPQLRGILRVGRIVGKSSEDHRQVVGNSLELHRQTVGKSSELHRQTVGKSSEDHRQIVGASLSNGRQQF